jgi:chemotaxis methyl-accepting protein methylase
MQRLESVRPIRRLVDDETSRTETLLRLTDKLVPGGALIIGKLESLPDGPWGLEPWSIPMGIYGKPLET